MKKFVLGLITALVLGAFVNIILGYIKFDYFKNPEKILGGLTKFFQKASTQQSGKGIDKDVKNCKDLISGTSSFGSLKVTVLGNGKPVENLEVDLNTNPGPVRCTQKTDKDGVALFSDVPATKMVIYFNSGSFPKELGKDPVVPVEITKDTTVEKLIELPYK